MHRWIFRVEGVVKGGRITCPPAKIAWSAFTPRQLQSGATQVIPGDICGGTGR